MKTIKFFTLGCKVNQYDTQNIREQFMQAGFKEAINGSSVDVFVINTCTVTQKADRDSFYYIRRARRENPKAKIIVTGCLSELEENRAKNEGASLIIKNKDKSRALKLFLNSPISSKLVNFFDHKLSSASIHNGISFFSGHVRAFLKIQDGCDNLCSYCRVPLARGGSRSRPLGQVISEAERLVKNGFKEIVLCGICLGAYGRDLKPKQSLVNVIDKLEKIEGLLRIRLSSIEAKDVSGALIKKMSSSYKLCRHLHIPLQSGDDEILHMMNRLYRRSDYLGLVKNIRRLIPQAIITTDVLVGFPGEKQRNFQNTVSLIKKIRPLSAHIFPYSKRPGTVAYGFKHEVDVICLKNRINKLKNIIRAGRFSYLKKFLNKKADVLIEGRSAKDPQFWEGLTAGYVRVLVKSDQDIHNKLISLKINKITNDYLLGRIIDR